MKSKLGITLRKVRKGKQISLFTCFIIHRTTIPYFVSQEV
ncbi:Positive transcriptional regulator, MutR family [Streptococcus pneumoniae]|nr:Positive transcriptional regulator, MutR family [Streptococcus pneumoniae]